MKKKPHIRLRPRLDPAGAGYPVSMRGLLSFGKPNEAMPYVEWAQQLQGNVPDLIRMAVDPDLNERDQRDRAIWAPLHALGVLTELAAPEAVEPLLKMLDWDDDWANEQLVLFYSAVGAAALPPLHDYSRDVSRSIGARASAVECIRGIGQRDAELRAAAVQILAGLLDKPAADTAAEESFAAWVIVGLLAMKAEEALPSIQRAFDEDRVNTSILAVEDVNFASSDTLAGEEDEFDEDDDLDDVEDESPEDRPLTVILQCKACGRERQYTFERAYFDLGTIRHLDKTQDSPFIVPERVVCPKCGAVDQYEVAPLSQLAILSKLTPLAAGLPDPMPRLEVVDFTSERWGWMPPRQMLPRYESEIAAHPDDTSLRLGYANVLRKLGYHERATDEYEHVLVLDPRHGDALIALAQMKADLAPIPDAIAAWEDVRRRFDQMWLPPEERDLREAEIEGSLEVLRAGNRPTYPAKRIPADANGNPLAPLAASPPPSGPAPLEMERVNSGEPVRLAPSQYGKVGRNEPCPCGSGKKYKQCHGKK